MLGRNRFFIWLNCFVKVHFNATIKCNVTYSLVLFIIAVLIFQIKETIISTLAFKLRRSKLIFERFTKSNYIYLKKHILHRMWYIKSLQDLTCTLYFVFQWCDVKAKWICKNNGRTWPKYFRNDTRFAFRDICF